MVVAARLSSREYGLPRIDRAVIAGEMPSSLDDSRE